MSDIFRGFDSLAPLDARFGSVPTETPRTPIEAAQALRHDFERLEAQNHDEEVRVMVVTARAQISALRAQLEAAQTAPRRVGLVTTIAVGLLGAALSATMVVWTANGAFTATLPALPGSPTPAWGSGGLLVGSGEPQVDALLSSVDVTLRDAAAAPTRLPDAPPERANDPAPKPIPITRDALLISQHPPSVSEAASQAGVEADVDVDITIDPRGQVTQATAVSGPERLRPPAEQAVREWRYEPALADGVPIESHRRVRLTFE